jgi:hypothetical protein
MRAESAALLRAAIAGATAGSGDDAGRLSLLLLQALPKAAGSPERKALRAGARAAASLQHAHTAPFVARDLRADEDGGTCAACERAILVTAHRCGACGLALCGACDEELHGPT